MNVLIWGLGYVGTVSAACFCELGHDVTGIEVNTDKVERLNAGTSPVAERGLPELISKAVSAGTFRATSDPLEHVKNADVFLICVGTPSTATGDTDIRHLCQVAAEISVILKSMQNYCTVVVRSTVFPGHMNDIVLPLLEAESGKQAGRDFGLAFNPEFLREANAVNDFFAPPYTIIGAMDERSYEHVARLYEGISAPVHRVTFDEAALLKLANNAFHALKIGFANEIGRLSRKLGLDGLRVMELVCADTKLNISPVYMQPGYAFGGSCLPKDLRSLSRNARRLEVDVSIMEAILVSNKQQIDYVRALIHGMQGKRIGFLGLSFKAGTDDLRESPVVELVRVLWQDGYDIRVFDPSVDLSNIIGANREYLFRQLPQASELMKPSIQDTVMGVDIVVITQKHASFLQTVLPPAKFLAVIDLVKISEHPNNEGILNYHGIAW